MIEAHPIGDPAERAMQLAELQRQLARCRACQDAGHLARANPVVGDQGARRLMLIGQAPGASADIGGIPFAGASGRILERWLQQAGFAPGALRRVIYLTSVTRCDPGRIASGQGDRPPSRVERALCARWWRAEIALIQPRVILLAGKMAIEEFYRPAPLEALVGTWRQESEACLLPLPHPSGVSRWLNSPSNRTRLDRALAQLSDWRVEFELEQADASLP